MIARRLVSLPLPVGVRSTNMMRMLSTKPMPAQEASEDKLENPHIDNLGRAYATGRRKTSVARVWIKEGSGRFTINNQLVSTYFQPLQRSHCLEPFLASNTAGLFDVMATVKGGGMSGQSGAIRLGLSRALQFYNASLRPSLKKAGFLTRDSRRVERKKPGQKKARKKYQWVKR